MRSAASQGHQATCPTLFEEGIRLFFGIVGPVALAQFALGLIPECVFATLRPAIARSWWARVRSCSMVGTLIFGPTSLHGRSHNVGYRNLCPCEQEPLDRSRIDYHEFFFLHLHGRDRRGADNRTPGEMARRN